MEKITIFFVMSISPKKPWTAILLLAAKAASWTFRRAGLSLPETRFLAEETAQEVALEILEKDLLVEKEDNRETLKVAWRISARLLREHKKYPVGMDQEVPGPKINPLELISSREEMRHKFNGLAEPEQALLNRIMNGDVPRRSTGVLHKSLLANEMGISRRALGRRLDNLKEVLSSNKR